MPCSIVTRSVAFIVLTLTGNDAIPEGKIMPKPVSIVALAQQYSTREKCVRLLEALRWPDGPECPRCSSPVAYRIESRLLYECGGCRH